jgi:hypothetical protein
VLEQDPAAPFTVPEARGCGALTDIINSVLSLPSPAGENDIRLPFSTMIAFGDLSGV